MADPVTVVRQFHEAFDLARRDTPGPQDRRCAQLRIRLIEEEWEEVRKELVQLMIDERQGTYGDYLATLGRLLKELCDLRYVVEGTAVSYGLPIDEAYVEVHRSNMSKLGVDGKPIVREDGKVLKGPDYFPPDMGKFVIVVEER